MIFSSTACFSMFTYQTAVIQIISQRRFYFKISDFTHRDFTHFTHTAKILLINKKIGAGQICNILIHYLSVGNTTNKFYYLHAKLDNLCGEF